ncbi:hypothetical protein NOVA_30420 [Nocardia nova]|jgi:hypothetical protein|uniref:DUF3263 domain-containing protein n=1 Tax=Nocardia nova TaxID=37330 RepID=A0A2S5ZZ71_9NOCA|nr:hypothetical protein [Nocardia nova]MBV7707107.1 hypothetical protein [Nocardia nova]PPI91276.1 hypothetical protein C5E46_30585 [Nocardia nova]PPJ23815.1 hypothetical protein C5F51_27400 [Nocardia nova]
MKVFDTMRSAPSAHARLQLAQRIRRYRQTRDLPRRTRHASPPHAYSETDEMVRLAEIWLPFGGPPEDEIFTRFGITGRAFEARLAQILGTGRTAAL